ncbi:hypothetical protein DACRYDRAFT_22423 [Dacryopinax primogenitus]|uniref:Uncharacterized protein n=1 Tax=Dacryopinax primogenitus (strain DJM 731) TaxID=1858805 RepID=M5FVZ9_DACPD|nr:uncharacterized protein DACRYDRAFT_22423 [Dacryopinax primogenitus]EJU02036.1 hypothetical protein DACRYDRAFT_22423 [Dacryopinax primogenitus]
MVIDRLQTPNEMRTMMFLLQGPAYDDAKLSPCESVRSRPSHPRPELPNALEPQPRPPLTHRGSRPPPDHIAHDHKLVLVPRQIERMHTLSSVRRSTLYMLRTTLYSLSCELVRDCTEGDEPACSA